MPWTRHALTISKPHTRYQELSASGTYGPGSTMAGRAGNVPSMTPNAGAHLARQNADSLRMKRRIRAVEEHIERHGPCTVTDLPLKKIGVGINAAYTVMAMARREGSVVVVGRRRSRDAWARVYGLPVVEPEQP